jgi:transcriptional regulator with XRE-family HTH domain
MFTLGVEMKSLGEKIRQLREQKDLSLREFAKRLDVSASFVSDIELGRRYPSDKVLVKIAAILGTSVEELQTYDSRPPVEEIKRLASVDPQYSVAFRQMVDIPAKELIEFLKKRDKDKSTK